MRFFATCAKGTEGALRRELSALRLHAVRGERGGVSFEGKLEAGMQACLHSRVAMRVLLELGRFPAEDAGSLYDGARALPWGDWLTDRTTLAVEATVRDAPALSHSGFAALKVKDAVVDALRERLGARPDVDPKDPDVRVVLHLAGGEAALSLDLAGEPLHRRGYRAVTGVAPLKETLAAAVLSLGGVAGREAAQLQQHPHRHPRVEAGLHARLQLPLEGDAAALAADGVEPEGRQLAPQGPLGALGAGGEEAHGAHLTRPGEAAVGGPRGVRRCRRRRGGAGRRAGRRSSRSAWPRT